MTLAFSIDGGGSWTTISGYTHPTSAGKYSIRLPIAPLIKQGSRVRFRISGTDAAAWGLRGWVLKYLPVPQEWDMT